RLGHCQREGLVLHDVRFDDDGTERTIARRMSIAELVIPYGDTGINGAARKAAFDTGEFGFGNYANSLTLGCDCLGEIVYLDVCTVDAEGEVHVVQNGICLHEEDFGVLWKHTDTDGHVEVRRGRRFVESSIATIDNYEYGYFWYFHQDGTIEFEAKLTGIVLTRAGVPGADPILAVEHKAIIEPDPERARARARAGIAWYLGLDNYKRNLLWMGYTEEDIADGGSDRLIDALFANGDAETVLAKLRGPLEAGSDHVAIQPLGEEDDPCGLRILEELAPLLR
ncbi:MAG: hypothetical protein ACKOSO_12085, partial [Actinomycetota bacterium]